MNNSEHLNDLFEFRPLTKNNLEDVQLLHDELLPVKYSDNFYKLLLNGLYKSLLLYPKDDDVLIGVSTWKRDTREPNETTKKRIQIGYLATFGIRQSFRRRGLGQYLLICTLAMMKDMKCLWSELHVLSTNTSAANLYVKCGYIIKMKLPNHYTFNDKLHDALLLIKSLKSSDESDSENESDYDAESHSVGYDNQERSLPYYTHDVNVDLDDPSVDSMGDNNTIHKHKNMDKPPPISNWISHSVDSLWIKCVIL